MNSKDSRVWKDRLVCTSKVKIPFFRRFLLIFHPYFEFKHEVHCKEIMPDHKASGELRTISYWDLFRAWKNRNKGEMSHGPESKQ